MATAAPKMTPTGRNTLMSSHRSSSHPAPPQTAIPEMRVPVTAHPVSEPLPAPEGVADRGRVSPRGGSFSAIAFGHYQPRVAGLSPSMPGGHGGTAAGGSSAPAAGGGAGGGT